MALYPSVYDIISVNEKVIKEVKVRKADKHAVLGKEKIEKALEAAKRRRGDAYDKAVVLFRGLIQAHPFASGNRRNAFVVVENFLLYNREKPKVNKDASASVLQGIREDYYGDDEIRRWLKGRKIREFRR